jgi:hypothetical protein
MGLKIKCVDSRVNVHILASTIVPFTLTTVQVPNLALTHKKRITVYDSAPARPLPPSPVDELYLFLSLPVCRQSSFLTGEGVGRGGGGAESYDRKKASINPADVLHLQLYLCDSDITFLCVQYVQFTLYRRSYWSVEINQPRYIPRVTTDRECGNLIEIH